MKRYQLLMKQKPKLTATLFAAVLLVVGGGICGATFISKKLAAESALSVVHEYTETVRWPMAFETQREKSYVHDPGHKAIRQAGAQGSKQLTYLVKVRGDGAELARTKLSEEVLTAPVPQIEVVGARLPQALTKAKSAQVFTDSKGVAHRETYYDLPMNVVMRACGAGGHYTVRTDGAKVDKDGYVIVAANYGNYPRCSVVETSMGPGKVYDTGGFAVRHPHGFDLATDWTRADGR